MSEKGPRDSRDAALSKLIQEKTALEESRRHLLNEIKRIDENLKWNQAEYGKIFNEDLPISQLPAEVTCMIFELFVSSHSLNDTNTGEQQSLLPEVVISHVCKHWRNISLNYPQLWTRFSFSIYTVKSLSKALTRFKVYLGRSGSRNLELFLDFREHTLEQHRRTQGERCPPRNKQRRLLDLAIKYINRWKIVTLLFEFEFKSEFPSLMTLSAPNLEHFAFLPSLSDLEETFDAENRGPRINSLNPTLLQGGTPKLRYLQLNCSNERMTPPFSNITTLRIEADEGHIITNLYSWNTFIEILSMPLLANLSIAGNFFVLADDRGVPIVTMNNLKHLRYSYNDCMTFILCFLRAPLLETLWICNDNDVPDIEPEEGELGSYFFPSLHTLVLVNFSPPLRYSDMKWKIIRELTENVTSLVVVSDPHRLSTGLDRSGYFHECWPKLTCITANRCFWDPCESHIFLELVLARPKDTLTLRLIKDNRNIWKMKNPDEYKAVQRNCIIEALDVEAEIALMEPLWPPGEDYPDYALRGDAFPFVPDYSDDDTSISNLSAYSAESL